MATTFANLIDGATVDSADRSVDINPSNTADVVGEFARASTADLDRAIAAAQRAFEGWSLSNPQQRFDVLDRAGTEILARKDELGRLLAREQGKPLADGVGEAARAGAIFKFFAGEALRLTGEKIDSVRPLPPRPASTPSASPDRRTSDRRSPSSRSKPARACSSKWAARIRSSSSMTPTSRPPCLSP